MKKNLPAKKKKKWALIGRSPLSIFIFILKRKHFFFKYGMDRKSLKYTIYDLVISPDKKVKNFCSHNSHYT